ncbi:MAG: phospholipase D-like domain-containing protein [Candidatus Omnitrophota bacterium]
MRKLKTTAFFLILMLAIVAGTGIFLCFAAEPYQATVEDISGAKYFPAVKEALAKAEKSVYLVMYLAKFDPQERRSRVYGLVEELVNAHKRGVKVKVILDQGLDFSTLRREEKNDLLFSYLKKQGIEVYFDELYRITHSKAIVIDEKIVVLGSTNWSDSSLGRNSETACLIHSQDLAKQVLNDFSRIPIDYEADVPEEEKSAAVALDAAFLQDALLGPQMVAMSDATALDLYLLLLKEFDGNAQGKMGVDYKKISAALGMDERMPYDSARDTLRQALIRLDKTYKLIDRRKVPTKNPYCLLVKITSSPREKTFPIPVRYWEYGWNRRLSLRAKFCLLINLNKTGAGRGRLWAGYRKALMEEFHATKVTISEGMQELRKLGIIEIEYPPYPEGGGYEKRAPVCFRFLGLYSPEALVKEKERLAGEYGLERFEAAQRYAGIVFQENNVQVIESIIKNMEEYGVSEVEKAFQKVARKAPDNPKRSYRYVVGILQSEAKE